MSRANLTSENNDLNNRPVCFRGSYNRRCFKASFPLRSKLAADGGFVLLISIQRVPAKNVSHW